MLVEINCFNTIDNKSIATNKLTESLKPMSINNPETVKIAKIFPVKILGFFTWFKAIAKAQSAKSKTTEIKVNDMNLANKNTMIISVIDCKNSIFFNIIFDNSKFNF